MTDKIDLRTIKALLKLMDEHKLKVLQHGQIKFEKEQVINLSPISPDIIPDSTPKENKSSIVNQENPEIQKILNRNPALSNLISVLSEDN